MEADPNPFPRIDLFPRFSRAFHFVFDHIRSEGLSSHRSPDKTPQEELGQLVLPFYVEPVTGNIYEVLPNGDIQDPRDIATDGNW